MLSDFRFVQVGAPARGARHPKNAVLDDGWCGDDVVLPGHIVDIDFHDAEVKDGSAEMRAHQAGEDGRRNYVARSWSCASHIAAILNEVKIPFQGTSTMATSIE